MKRRFMRSVTQFLLFLVIAEPAMSLSTVHLVGATPVPSVFVDPLHSTAYVGSSFDVRVNVSGAVGLTGYGVSMRFDQTLLVVTGWQSGGFLESSGIGTIGIVSYNQSDHGYISLGDYLVGPGAASGDGSLVILSFKVIASGNCTLDIYDTQLTDQNNNLVDHTEADGYFTALSTQEFPLLQVLIIVVVAILLAVLAYGMKRARSGKAKIKQTARRKSFNRATNR